MKWSLKNRRPKKIDTTPAEHLTGIFAGMSQQEFQEQYPYPHCNAEVLHAPEICKYCDMYPERQAAREAGKTPFTPAESNGWGGNVAVPE
jgi:hypothetical protein